MGCEWSYLCPPSATEGPAKQALLKPKAIAITFGSQYHLGEKLGEGAFSVVRKCVHIGSGTAYAAKCLDLRNISPQDLRNIEREVKILQQLHHPNVISCKDYFLESTTGYIVTDLMEGGDLFDRIVEKSVYTEREAKDVVHAVVDAVAYCHAKRIVHRDLKPENILLSSHDDCTAVIKVADFGLAKDESYLTTMCGSPAYVAPEVLSGDRGLYNKAVDVWSVGVITFALLSGYLPFFDDNPSQMFKKIKHGAFSFESPYWDDISPCAKAFVKAALVVDPSMRYCTYSLLLTCRDDSGTANDATVPLSSALSGLRTLSKRTSLKTAAKAEGIVNRRNNVIANMTSVLRETASQLAKAKKPLSDLNQIRQAWMQALQRDVMETKDRVHELRHDHTSRSKAMADEAAALRGQWQKQVESITDQLHGFEVSTALHQRDLKAFAQQRLDDLHMMEQALSTVQTHQLRLTTALEEGFHHAQAEVLSVGRRIDQVDGKCTAVHTHVDALRTKLFALEREHSQRMESVSSMFTV
ncbi:hypothetical protein DYB25_005402, partial [Aphanomyces astaci]